MTDVDPTRRDRGSSRREADVGTRATDDARPLASRAKCVGVLMGVVALVSLGVRLFALADMRVLNPLFEHAILDDAMYLKMAAEFRDGASGAWLMAPLYPWILAQWARAFELGLGSACMLNVLLGAATSATCAYAGYRLHSARAGWCAGLVHALAGGFVFYDIVPGQAPVLSLLHVIALVLAIRLAREKTVWLAVAIGLLAGVATLGRGTSLAIAFACAPALWRTHGVARVRLAGAVAVGVALVLGAAAARNLSVTGEFSPFHWNGGPNLYASNGPQSRAGTAYVIDELGATPRQIAESAKRVAEAERDRELTPGEVSSFWVSRTWKTRGSLAEHATHFARKAGIFIAAEETPNIHAPMLEAEFSRLLSVTGVRVWWLIPFGLAGWWLIRQRLPESSAGVWMFVATWGALTLYFPVARYRVPVAAVCAVLGGAGVGELWSGVVPRRRAIGAACVGLVAVILAWLPYRQPASGAISHANLAAAYMELGRDRDLAAEHLDAALALDPQRGFVHLTWGHFLIASDPAAAAEHLTLAIRDPSVRDAARRLLLRARVAEGAVDSAEALVHDLYADFPNHPEVLAYAAVLAWNAGDEHEATRRLAVARHVTARDDYAPLVWAREATGISDGALDDAIREILGQR